MPDFLLGKYFVPSQADWISSIWNKNSVFISHHQYLTHSVFPRWLIQSCVMCVQSCCFSLFKPLPWSVLLLIHYFLSWWTVIIRFLIYLISIAVSCVIVDAAIFSLDVSWAILPPLCLEIFPSVMLLPKFFFHPCFLVQLAFEVFALWVVCDTRPNSCTPRPSFPYALSDTTLSSSITSIVPSRTTCHLLLDRILKKKKKVGQHVSLLGTFPLNLSFKLCLAFHGCEKLHCWLKAWPVS